MTHIRILYRDLRGIVTDGQMDFGPEHFGGHVPAIGDVIVDPGVLQGQDRNLPQNRQVWPVVGRVFNPRYQEDTIALIVETRDGNQRDQAFL